MSISLVDEEMIVFLDESNRAPYLRASADDWVSKSGIQSVTDDESDVAGGSSSTASVLKRVSSFKVMVRSTSMPFIGNENPPQLRQARADSTASTRSNRQGAKSMSENPHQKRIEPNWRLQDRRKTVGVGLVLALNVGTDPPDIIKPHPCAKLQTWMDPTIISRSKAIEKIGSRLESQYMRWQQRTAKPLKFRRALDPTVEDVRGLCLWLRRQAKTERVLLHYNGHGVPKPTDNGEIWVTDRNKTEYIPVPVSDLRQWMGKPNMVILDCSAAGVLLPFLTCPLEEPSEALDNNEGSQTADGSDQPMDMATAASLWIKDTIVLCPTSEHESLPMHPDYPADVFTACLTTPIKMALRWFVRNNPHSTRGLDPDAVDAIPGTSKDRLTPLGELNWIFIAVTDSIAWDVLPTPLFQRLFRQDLVIASMFRNFFLADRILRSLNCTPQSHPPLPPGIADHPLWMAWDLACETCLFTLMKNGVLGNHVLKPTSADPSTPPQTEDTENVDHAVDAKAKQQSKTNESPQIPFFEEQLTAFETWLRFASIQKASMSKNGGNPSFEPPEQLPALLQALLSPVHRVRALMLLKEFLNLGPWAVNLTLRVGIVFPYVMKMLPSPDHKAILVGIWASILQFDPSCRQDLMKDNAFQHFIQIIASWMTAQEPPSVGVNIEGAKQRTMAAFNLSVACFKYPQAQMDCFRQNLHVHCCSLLSSHDFTDPDISSESEFLVPAALRLWLCICLGNIVSNNPTAQREAIRANVHRCLFSKMRDRDPQVRAAICYAFSLLLETGPDATNAPHAMAPQPPPPSIGSPMYPNSPRGSPFMPNPNVLVPQQLSASTMTMPSGLTGSGVLSGQLRQGMGASIGDSQTFQPSMLDLNSTNPMQPRAGQHAGYQQASMGHGGVSIDMTGNSVSSGQLRSPMLRQQVHSMQPNMLGLGSGSTSVMPSMGLMNNNSSLMTGVPMSQPRQKPSVFENIARVDIDLSIMNRLMEATSDGSPVVRFEALMSLARIVQKYLQAFLIVADGTAPAMVAADQSFADASTRMGVPIPRGLTRSMLEDFSECWKTLRAVQTSDTHPRVSNGAYKIVKLVNEQLLDVRRADSDKAPSGNEKKLTGIDEDTDGIELERVESVHTFQRWPSRMISSGSMHSQINALLSPTAMKRNQQASQMRRVTSEQGGWQSSQPNAEAGQANASWDKAGSRPVAAAPTPKVQKEKKDIPFPKSQFYEWKSEAFDTNYDAKSEKSLQENDPLCPIGATRDYQRRRNRRVFTNAHRLAQRYEELAPSSKQKRETNVMLDEDKAEKRIAMLRNELKMKEKQELHTVGMRVATMLKFHSYEDVLMACDDESTVTVWNYETGRNHLTFENGNIAGSKMTTSGWINEESNSLFFVGCDDGSVRVWDGLLARKGDISQHAPSLATSFHAIPGLVPGKLGGSGLVCEWQQSRGTLIAGGASDSISCWDLASERCERVLKTETDACMTSLTTTWDDAQGLIPGGYQGMSPDTILAGFGDGTLRVFDIRSSDQPAASIGRRSRRPTRFTDHCNSWIVDTYFTNYGGRFEVISGSMDGVMKAWDLRMSNCTRSLTVQRSAMTAMAVHRKIPIAATGSQANFIKFLTLDGEALQVAKSHDKSGHRIGPIRCLEFHKHKLVLAAGTTKALVSVFQPRDQPKF